MNPPSVSARAAVQPTLPLETSRPEPASLGRTGLGRPFGRWAVPIAALVALAVHGLVSRKEPVADSRSYALFLEIICGLFAVLGAVRPRFWPPLRRWMEDKCPILAAAVLTLCGWEIITSG